MATHNVVVPSPMEKSIETLVESGRYQNFSEVVRAGLRMVLEHEAEESARLEALRNSTSVGLMQLEAGEFDEVEADQLGAYLDELGQVASKKG